MDQWARSPVTVAFQNGLAKSIEDAKETWAQTGYTSEQNETTLRLNAVALAQVGMLRQVIETIESYKIVPKNTEEAADA